MKNQDVSINKKRDEILAARKEAENTKLGNTALLGFLTVFAGGLIILIMFVLLQFGKQLIDIL